MLARNSRSNGSFRQASLGAQRTRNRNQFREIVHAAQRARCQQRIGVDEADESDRDAARGGSGRDARSAVLDREALAAGHPKAARGDLVRRRVRFSELRVLVTHAQGQPGGQARRDQGSGCLQHRQTTMRAREQARILLHAAYQTPL